MVNGLKKGSKNNGGMIKKLNGGWWQMYAQIVKQMQAKLVIFLEKQAKSDF